MATTVTGDVKMFSLSKIREVLLQGFRQKLTTLEKRAVVSKRGY